MIHSTKAIPDVFEEYKLQLYNRVLELQNEVETLNNKRIDISMKLDSLESSFRPNFNKIKLLKAELQAITIAYDQAWGAFKAVLKIYRETTLL